mmetsp:Transcript_73000/g.159629  ORF Transcript_73000/g.159629 Transcript_73000/m.159629 type:complete len:90 (-) Transcript_73000:783-1052(-)
MVVSRSQAWNLGNFKAASRWVPKYVKSRSASTTMGAMVFSNMDDVVSRKPAQSVLKRLHGFSENLKASKTCVTAPPLAMFEWLIRDVIW